jgi:cobalt-zinc-cadmium efflux system membrane fusion protein
VDPATRAAPLVADIQNDDRLLKPGLFVRVLLPVGEPLHVLAVPDSAIVRHEGRIFVFVATGPAEFTPRDITVGLSVDPWVEVKSGLVEGDRIAVSGTFVLKSELLLEPEE